MFDTFTEGARTAVMQADAAAIAAAVERCPTGALSYTRTDGAADEMVSALVTIRVTRGAGYALQFGVPDATS